MSRRIRTSHFRYAEIAHHSTMRETFTIVVVADRRRHTFVPRLTNQEPEVLADTVRSAAKQTLAELRKSGVEHLIMLSGENPPTAEATAREVGIEEVHAELRPTDKIAALDKLVERNGNVTMVGDGIIDAPVFGIATVDIAMGGIGSDAAIETGDFALIGAMWANCRGALLTCLARSRSSAETFSSRSDSRRR